MKKKYMELLLDMGMFFTMNIAKLNAYGTDQAAAQELTAITQHFNSTPVVNGKKLPEIINDTAFAYNPEVIKAVLKFVYSSLIYVKPRIQKFCNKDGQAKYLPRITQLEDKYKEVVAGFTK